MRPRPPGASATPTPDCSRNGTCVSGACVCTTGYAGANCDACAAGYEGFPACRPIATDPCAGITCSGNGTCSAGACRCNAGWDGPACDRCATGYLLSGGRCVRDLCVGVDCSAHGRCASTTGLCACDAGYAGARCGQCDAGFSGYPSCVRTPAEVCNGVDDDGNGIVDDSFSCWRAIYRFVQDATGARCLGPSTTAPAACAGYRFEREAFIVATAGSGNTYRAVQCSRATDHIVIDGDSSDRGALVTAGYDCSLELGFVYRSDVGRTPFTHTCPLWRYRYAVTGGGAHLFTRGNDAVSAFVCEAPSRGWVATNDTCFGAHAPGCP